MSEDAIVILLTIFWATVAYAAYLRFIVVRGLRNKLDKIADAAIAAHPVVGPAVSPAPHTEPNELRQIQQRLQVLERIAVEKENALSREIDGLRATG